MHRGSVDIHGCCNRGTIGFATLMFDHSTVVNREFVTFCGRIVFIERVLIVGVAKHAIPFIRHEIWEGANVSCNRGEEPVGKHYVELCGDVARGGIEYKRDSAGVIRGESHVDATHAAWSPLWKLHAPRDLRIKDINWAAPNMNIMKLALLPTRLGKTSLGARPVVGLGTWFLRNTAWSTAMGHNAVSVTSGQWMAACNIIVCATNIIV